MPSPDDVPGGELRQGQDAESLPPPGELPGAVRGALQELTTRIGPDRRLLVALDFDGVLAPLVTDPTQSRPLPASHRALGRLSGHPDVEVALVSGRALTVLNELATPPAGTVLIGSHGAEHGRVGPDGSAEVQPLRLTPEQSALRRDLLAGLDALTRTAEGAWVEHKPAAVVLHTRTVADRAVAARVAAEAAALAEGLGVTPMLGKEVVELAVVRHTKGGAVGALRTQPGVGPVLFVGDDVTDETVFEVLREGDLGVKVGPGPTAARLRVADPTAVAVLLETLVDLLDASRGGTAARGG